MAEQDVIVIGAGVAGLTAATVAARDGAAVTLLERKSVLGGRATTDVIDGFAFNQGGHALYANGVGVEVLAKLGITVRGERPPIDAAGMRGDAIAGALPTGPASLVKTKLLSPASRARSAKVLAKVLAAKPAKVNDVCWQAWIEDATSDPDVQDVFTTLVRLTTYANAPALVSAGAVLEQLQLGNHGVLYLHDGWQQLVDGLEAVASAAGVAITTGAEVSTVEAIDDRWEVTVGDVVHVAAAVVLAGLAPVICARLLGRDDDTFAHAGPAAEAAVLDVGLDGEPDTRFILGLDRPTYFGVHGPPASMAPEGKAAAVAMKYLPIGEETALERDRADLDAIVAAAGPPTILADRFLRRMTVTHGIPLASQGGLAGRPAVAVADRPGVYLAGDWVGDRGLLVDASFASGDAAGAAAAERAAAHRAPVGASS